MVERGERVESISQQISKKLSHDRRRFPQQGRINADLPVIPAAMFHVKHCCPFMGVMGNKAKATMIVYGMNLFL
jgi:hypothetical protein